MGGHKSEGRHTAARQRAPLLPRQHHARWRRGRVRHQPARCRPRGEARRMRRQQRRRRRAAHQSDAAHRDGQCADGAFSRLGYAQHTTTCQPLSDSARAPAGGTDQGSDGFPDDTGIAADAPEPGFINPLLDYDWGSGFDPNDGSGVLSNAVPPIKQVIKSLVPKVDADGNEIGGVPVVLREAPLGTYLGWNIIADGIRPFHKGKLCGNAGSIIPFAKTKAERLANSDPRLSLEERYADHAGYVAAVRKAAANAVAQKFLLQKDADALIAAADASNVLK